MRINQCCVLALKEGQARNAASIAAAEQAYDLQAGRQEAEEIR
jgi:hypothetical protein